MTSNISSWFKSTHLKYLVTCLVFVAFSGCTSNSVIIQGELPTKEDRKPHDMLRAGAAKIDITPPPGIPMGGHSVIGQISRGQWLRLKARSLYIEAKNGSKLALIAADLWSMPAGLANRVVEINAVRAEEKCRLRREQMIFAATHTHQSPGNFSSSPLYNAHGSSRGGFDQDLFEFLARQLAKAVRKSCEDAEDATLSFESSQVLGLGRNRSIDAFLKNLEADKILREGNHFPEGKLPSIYSDDMRAYHAIDPRLQTLWIKSAAKPHQVIGVGAFTAVHPTALSHKAKVYSSDLFGVAATIAEQELKTENNAPVVVIFNGAEGDVSPAWEKQDRQNVIRLGKILGKAILKTKNSGTAIKGNFKAGFGIRPLAGQPIKGLYTREHFRGGPSALGGAEDGRVPLGQFFGCQEGWNISITKPSSWIKPLCWLAVNPIVNSIASSTPPPNRVPIAVYTLGSIAFATLPGEFTTVMGRRIRNDLAKRLKVKNKNMILLGLANEYASYFTTPEEYKAGHYEAGMTLYGEGSGMLVGEHLNKLAGSLSQEPLEPVTGYHYEVGEAKKFTPEDLSPIEPNKLKSNMIETMFSKSDLKHGIHSACWDGPAPTISEAAIHGWDATPSVKIEIKQPNSPWRPLMNDGIPEDDQGLNLIIQLSEWNDMQSKWCAFWLPSLGLKETRTLRFNITDHDKITHHTSDPFNLE